MKSSIFSAYIHAWSATVGIKIDLLPMEKRCVGQELDHEDSAKFYFGPKHPKSGAEQVMRAYIIDPSGNNVFDEQIKTGTSKEFVKSIDTRGVYQMCFALQKSAQPIQVVFGVNFKSRNSEKEKTTGKEDFLSLENQLAQAEELLKDVSNEIDFAKRQEQLLLGNNERTNTRIQLFSLLSILILLVLSIYQLLYLRNFFISKKLI